MKYIRGGALARRKSAFQIAILLIGMMALPCFLNAESEGASHGDSSHQTESPSTSESETASHGSVDESSETPEEDDKEQTEEEAETEEKEPEEETDAVLLLDASGSMRITDPARLRDEGADLFAQFLGEEDFLSIIEFAEETRVIRPLTQFKRDSRREIIEQIAKVGNSGLYTDLLAGIKAAHDVLKNEGRPGAKKVIILLSDGKMDPDPKKGTATRLTDYMIHDFLPELKREGVQIHTLAFSNQVDRDLLTEIAETTEGVDWFTETVDDIHESFAELFLVVKKPQMVPMSGKGFLIDENVREATFYINNNESEGEVKIISPDGYAFTKETKKSNIIWYSGQKFDVVTINEPIPGEWEVVGLPKGEGFATVLTNLKLITDWSNSVIAASPTIVEARLYEDEKPVVLPEMANVSKFIFQVTPTDKVSEPIIREVLVDDGTNGDRQPGDGVFSRFVTVEEPGEYQMRVLARGPTFERQQVVPFRVKERLVTLDVVAVERSTSLADDEHGKTHTEAGGTTKEYFRVKLSAEVASLKKVSIELLAVNDSGKKYQLPLQQSKDVSLYYEVPAAALPADQKYQLQAFVSGESKRKETISGSSQVLSYDRSTHDIDEGGEDVSLIVVAEDEKEEEEEAPSPVPYLILVTLINAGVGALCFILLQKSQGEISFSIPKYEPAEELLKSLSDLEELANKTEVDPDDPIFEQESVPLPSAELLAGGDVPASVSTTHSADAGEEAGAEPDGDDGSSDEDEDDDASSSAQDAEPTSDEGEAEEPSDDDEEKAEE